MKKINLEKIEKLYNELKESKNFNEKVAQPTLEQALKHIQDYKTNFLKTYNPQNQEQTLELQVINEFLKDLQNE